MGDYFVMEDLAEARRLGEAGRNGSLALFIGAGTSVPPGLPTWKSLIESLAKKANLPESMLKSFGDLSPLDQAEHLQQKLGADGLASSISELARTGDLPRRGSHVGRERPLMAA